MPPAHRRQLALPAGLLVLFTLVGCSAETAPTAGGSTTASSTQSSAPSPSSTTPSTAPAPGGTPAAPPSAGPAGQPGVTAVAISFSAWNATDQVAEVGAYAVDVIETGGACTLTLTRGSVTRTTRGIAEPDATTTSCGYLAVPGSDLSRGEWTVAVNYESPTATGVSDATTIEVP